MVYNNKKKKIKTRCLPQFPKLSNSKIFITFEILTNTMTKDEHNDRI